MSRRDVLRRHCLKIRQCVQTHHEIIAIHLIHEERTLQRNHSEDPTHRSHEREEIEFHDLGAVRLKLPLERDEARGGVLALQELAKVEG